METKRLILLMAVGMLVILGWTPLMHRVGTMMGYDMSVRQPAATTAPASPVAPGALPAAPFPTTAPVAPMPAAPTQPVGGYGIVPPDPARSLPAQLGVAKQNDAAFALAMTINPAGAGVDGVSLNDYKMDLRKGEPLAMRQRGSLADAEAFRALSVREASINGTALPLSGAAWTLTEHETDAADGKVSATYELTIARDGVPALTIQRQYTLFTRDGGSYERDGRKYEPLGFEFRVRNAFRNLTAQPMNVGLTINGQGVPPSESAQNIDAFYVVGTGVDGAVKAHGYAASSIGATPVDVLAAYKDDGQPWYVGATTSYFTALQRFEPLPEGKAPADRLAGVRAVSRTPDDYTGTRATEVLVDIKPVEVAPGAEASYASRVYYGPKKREFLSNAHYAQPWVRYDQTLVLAQGWEICGICTWQWLINILFGVLKAIHFVTRDWGLAIIGLTCIVRLALHPITKRAQMNMLKFGKLAPEMERIKKKHAGDQDAMNRAMMGFYKEHGTTQVMGCLPMFLQMPIWIALWQAMNTTFELRHQPFLYGLTWIDDLSKPDHLIDFAAHGWPVFTLPLLSFVTISGINVLPLIFGFLQFLQFKIQPKPPTMTEEQRQQQAMTQWMMLIIFPIFMYASPSGLLIYMITSFTIGIIESKIVKRQFEAQSAHEARFTVVEDDAPTPANAVKATVRRKPEPQPKKAGLMGMIEEARRKAAEMQAEIEKNRKRGR